MNVSKIPAKIHFYLSNRANVCSKGAKYYQILCHHFERADYSENTSVIVMTSVTLTMHRASRSTGLHITNKIES